MTGRGVALITALSISTACRPRNGGWPVTISYSTTPRLKTSVRWSAAWPEACSGELYPIEPYGTPTSVSGSSVLRPGVAGPLSPASGTSIFARPKSRMRAWPPGPTMMFAGLRSRWTMPAACATASASASWIAIESAESVSSGRPPMNCLSVGPSTYWRTM